MNKAIIAMLAMLVLSMAMVSAHPSKDVITSPFVLHNSALGFWEYGNGKVIYSDAYKLMFPTLFKTTTVNGITTIDSPYPDYVRAYIGQ